MASVGRRAIALGVVLACFGAWLHGQNAAPPNAQANRPATGIIVGVVSDGDSHAPIAAATVRLIGRPVAPGGRGGAVAPPQDAVVTGDDGRFVFHDLPKSSYSIAVQAVGYMPGAFGQRSTSSAGRQTIALDDGQLFGNASISVWKYAAMSGTVVDEAGEPIVGTTVKACVKHIVAGRIRWEVQLAQANAFTDDRGMFHHTALEPGDYILVIGAGAATIPVSFRDSYAQGVRDGVNADLQREMDASSVMVPTNPGIRIGDFILDAGNRHFGTMDSGAGIRPGPGLVPLGKDGKVMTYRTMFYPAASTPEGAQVISLHAGEERRGLDFQLTPMPAVRISGTVTGPDGPQKYLQLNLRPVFSGDNSTRAAVFNYQATTDAKGAFTFLGVAPGNFELRMTRLPLAEAIDPNAPRQPPSIPTEATLWSFTPVTVDDRDIDGIAVTLRQGLRVSGRLVFEGTAPPPPTDRLVAIPFDLEPAIGAVSGATGIFGVNTPWLARPDASGRVTSYGVPAGDYIVTMGFAPAPWSLKSIMYEGRDVSTVPIKLTDHDLDGLVITLTDRPTKLTGTVRTSAGTGDEAAAVVVFPVEPSARVDVGSSPRRVRATRASKDGVFTFTGLPVGDYFAVALADESVRNWSAAANLERLSGLATRVRVVDTGSASVDLKTVRTP